MQPKPESPRPSYTHHAGLLLVSETEISKLYSGPKLPAGSGSWLIVSVAQIRLGWGAAGEGLCYSHSCSVTSQH